MKNSAYILTLMLIATSFGCKGAGTVGPPVDRPFPVGQATDAFWETQQTNAEAADFVFYDHEFVGDTAELAPGAKKKLMAVALRLEHVPFPITIEESLHNARPQLDLARRRTVVEQLARLGIPQAENRVVIASAFAEGITAVEGEANYYQVISGNIYEGGRGAGGAYGGFGGGTYR
ncbi:MAG: hypothetical protein WD030_05720 [Pirellulales bacterium]